MMLRQAVLKHLDLSARGRTRVVLWTVLGTLGCILATLLFDSGAFMALEGDARSRAITNDVLIPLTLAPPLLWFLTAKLRELAIAHHNLALVASTDSLTSVLNRGAFTTLVDAYLTQVRQCESDTRGALLVVDADHFKVINDSFGHDCGDEALKIIAATIRGTLRGPDIVGRIGGEEFGVFLPGSSPRQAEAVAERIRKSISEVDFRPDGTSQRLSVSVGGASFEAEVAFQELFRIADRRLYEAKRDGRNRIAVGSVNGHAAAPMAAA